MSSMFVCVLRVKKKDDLGMKYEFLMEHDEWKLSGISAARGQNKQT